METITIKSWVHPRFDVPELDQPEIKRIIAERYQREAERLLSAAIGYVPMPPTTLRPRPKPSIYHGIINMCDVT